MKQRRTIAIRVVLAIALLALLALAFWPRQKEPRYQGKKLSQWVAEAPGNPEAEAAVVRLGTNMIPQLLSWLDYRPSKVRTWLEALLNDPPVAKLELLRPLLATAGHRRAELARQIVHILGARASIMIPALVRRARESSGEDQDRAFGCLQAIGEPAFPAVAAIAANPRDKARQRAVLTVPFMENLGTNRAPAVRLLCGLADDPDPGIANHALVGIGILAAEPDIALPVLSRNAEKKDALLACRAIDAITDFGTNGVSLVPQLILALTNSTPSVRERATNGVRRLAPQYFETNRVARPRRLMDQE